VSASEQITPRVTDFQDVNEVCWLAGVYVRNEIGHQQANQNVTTQAICQIT
jgi:hypothetical protein